jgi:predicted nucleic acid-binding protein
MREWTRAWWEHRARYDVATSTAVLAELETGGLPHREEAYAMAMALPAVPVDEAIEEIVRVYVARQVMPRDPLGDALHLALACFHKFDYLLTWNCQHLANANKFAHIRRVNALLGLNNPELVTPLELMAEGE